MITKIKIKNYKKFISKEIKFNPIKNILVGENGVGKTSILEAIDLVLSGSFTKIEKIGIKSLFNVHVINDFLKGNRKYEDLPKLKIELYIHESIQNDQINGIHHEDGDNKQKNGLYLEIFPDDQLSKEIAEILVDTHVFPFEYYKIQFKTFSDKSYNAYNRYKDFAKHSFIRNDFLTNQFKMREYVDSIFEDGVAPQKRKEINNMFRNENEKFKNKLYEDSHLSDEIQLDFDSANEKSFQKNITILNDGVDVSHIGHGEQLLLNTEMKMKKSDSYDLLLIEEPENHLSHINMHRLIEMLNQEETKQIFISTHSNMISSRLDLKNIILISEQDICDFASISNDTSKFFVKAPNTNLLNFILSKKALLVEGDAEYILLNEFYKIVNGNNAYDDSVTIISCGGKTFKRYLELADMLKIKVAVVTDNDRDYQTNVINSYIDFSNKDNIRIFFDSDNSLWTFEICIYECNKVSLEKLMNTALMNKGLLNFMLSNKTEFALRLLNLISVDDSSGTDPEISNEKFNIPDYIKKAILWVK